MPRNGSSVYSLPAGNPVIPGTVIATTWANTTLTDIATALTNSLSTDGSTASVSLSGKTMTGGTFSGPSVTGVLTLTGGQIAFPAVQVPSAGANVLDDYEEGTWTPALTFGSPGNQNIAYSVQSGMYVKIGQVVNLTGQVTTSTFTHSTASGSLFMTGVPFSNNATLSSVGSVAFSFMLTTPANEGTCSCRLQASATQLDFIMCGINNNAAGVLDSNKHPSGSLSFINITITYRTTA